MNNNSLLSITTLKPDNLIYCFHNVIACDITPLPSIKELDEFTRDNAQMFVNRLFNLPFDSTEDGLFVKLDKIATLLIPRSKPIPKPKAKTRWQIFAESQGIQKRKRSKLVFDEKLKDWVSRHGYKSVKKNKETAEGIIELKDNDDPFEDKFEQGRQKKQMEKAKQKVRELRNISESSGSNKDKKRKETTDDLKLIFDGKKSKLTKGEINEAMKRAQISTASFGNFDRKVKKDDSLLPQTSRIGVKYSKKGITHQLKSQQSEQQMNSMICKKIINV